MESLVKPGGELVSPIYLIGVLGGILGGGPVTRFQIVQEALDRVTLKVVVDDTCPAERIAADLETVRARLADLMGGACVVERVADIPTQASGKYLYTVCHVAPEQRAAALAGFGHDSSADSPK
jgi:hypothetical protein